MFASMNIDLPGWAEFLLDNFAYLYPLLFVGLAILVVTKEAFMQDKRFSLVFTLVTVLVVTADLILVKRHLYSLIADYVEKLHH